MKISIPKLSLVILIGPSGSGKSTFARQHFLPTEVLSSDACRALVSDEENNQAVTNDAFEVLHFVAAKRLALGRLTVIDATNVQVESRRPLVALARQHQSQLRRALRGLAKEGFRHVFVLETPEDVDAAGVERVPLYNDKRTE